MFEGFDPDSIKGVQAAALGVACVSGRCAHDNRRAAVPVHERAAALVVLAGAVLGR
jgi:hypothetical protein